MASVRNALLMVTLGAAIWGCSSEKKADSNGSTSTPQTANSQNQAKEDSSIQYQMSGIPFELSGKPVTIAGITFTPAIQWQDLGASDMRAASYKYGPLESDKEPANLSVFFFGPGQGGTIEANVDRWMKQMTMPDGGDPAKAAIRYTMDVNGMPTHVVTLFGTFNESMGGPMSGKTTPRENYRLIGVIVEAPKGNVFFKLTGPDYSAKIMVEAFMTMVKQIQKT